MTTPRTVTHSPATASEVTTVLPRSKHHLDDYAAGLLRHRRGFDPSALHSARTQIERARAATSAYRVASDHHGGYHARPDGAS